MVNKLEVVFIILVDGLINSFFIILVGMVCVVYGKNVIVIFGIMIGNIDMRFYWNLMRYIFWFVFGYDVDDEVGLGKIYIVDERVSVLNYVYIVRWFVMFVWNMDEVRFDMDGGFGKSDDLGVGFD